MKYLNCDIGERGINHPIDNELMKYIHIANIACGGHAGSIESVEYYTQLAKHYGVLISAHLSYPDQDRFGRVKMEIATDELLASLTTQYQLLPCGMIKFHGALYHVVNNDATLANEIGKWLLAQDVQQLIAPPSGYLISYCQEHGIKVITEGFIERGYDFVDGKLQLIPRGQYDAELVTVADALEQYRYLETGVVNVAGVMFDLNVDTLCIHSDSLIALDLVKAIVGVE